MSENGKFQIILPLCIESEFDVFLNVLKCAVARSKFDENKMIGAFMYAIKGKSFVVKTKDLTRSWTTLKSDAQLIRQCQLLGYWTIANFPSICQKLFGEEYQLPTRNTIFVDGGEELDPQKIDDIVSAKMKLRVIELSVNGSTFAKLKNFVKVPVKVGSKRNNEIRVSRKMVSFDVDEDFIANCWAALRSGVFTPNEDNEHPDETVMYPFVTTAMDEVPNGQIDTPEQTTPVAKRKCRRRCSETSGVVVDQNCGDSMDYSENPLHEVLFKIRDDVGTLTKSIQEVGSERLHTMIFKEKNAEISFMKKSSIELKEANETLTNTNAHLEKQLEEQKSVVASINSELQVSFESKVRVQREAKILAAKLLEAGSDIAAKARDFNISVEVNQQLRAENESLKKKLAETEKFFELNEKMKEELATLKSRYDTIVVELGREVGDLVKLNSESVEQNKELQLEIERLKIQAQQSQVNACKETCDDEESSTSILMDPNVQNQAVSTIQTKGGAGNPSREESDLSQNSDESSDNAGRELTHYEETEIETDDPIVRECLTKLMKLKFGWMKFSIKKNAKYWPGFVHPPGTDGICRAQKVSLNGYPSLSKEVFFDFKEFLPEADKKSAEKSALNKFNRKFKLNLD